MKLKSILIGVYILVLMLIIGYLTTIMDIFLKENYSFGNCVFALGAFSVFLFIIYEINKRLFKKEEK